MSLIWEFEQYFLARQLVKICRFILQFFTVFIYMGSCCVVVVVVIVFTLYSCVCMYVCMYVYMMAK